jgi:hypothetical protein
MVLEPATDEDMCGKDAKPKKSLEVDLRRGLR